MHESTQLLRHSLAYSAMRLTCLGTTFRLRGGD